jgi:hypothetical protein
MEPAEPAFAGIGLWFAVPFVSNGEWSVARRSLPQLGPAHVELRACRIFASLCFDPRILIQIRVECRTFKFSKKLRRIRLEYGQKPRCGANQPFKAPC